MENLNYDMSEFKVISLSGLSIISMELLSNLLILGQPYVNGVIGILTVIYLIKKIICKEIKNSNFI